MIVAFVGHARVSWCERVKDAVKKQIVDIITSECRLSCYVGNHGDFDEICACACRDLKKQGLDIELVFVTPYISESQQHRIKEMMDSGLYDATVYPPIESVSPRFAISKRNEWMMTNADVVIAYVNRTYGGAYKALCTAKRHSKKIINISHLY